MRMSEGPDTGGIPAHILNPRPLVVVVSGPSGVGKDETIKRMLSRGADCHFVVTATTRPRRAGELDGKDYLFVSHEQFNRMLEANELLEHAVVYGEHKGIPRQQVAYALACGKDVILRVDVQGAATIKRLLPSAVFIFVVAENMQELMRRLRERKGGAEGGLRQRMATAREEMRRMAEFDYVVVNANRQLDTTVDAILAIMRAEKQRPVARTYML
jgi:guanylate kinase